MVTIDDACNSGWQLVGQSPGAYPGGMFWTGTLGNPTFQAVTGEDLAFRTWVI